MAIRITDTSGVLWTFVHDEFQHEGQAPSSTLSYGVQIDGSQNPDQIVVPCPVEGCGSVSYWPREALSEETQAKLPAVGSA